MEPAEELDCKVLRWLADQGYPFELEVGRVFQEEGWRPDYSRYYTDPVTAKSREIDICADVVVPSHEAYFVLTCVVECKTTTSYPWVVFTSQPPPALPGDFAAGPLTAELVATYARATRNVQPLALLDVSGSVGHGVVRALTKPNQGDPTSAYAGVQTCVNAASEFARRVPEWPSDTAIHWTSLEMVVPVVVIKGKLFEYSLNEGNSPELVEVQRSKILGVDPTRSNVRTQVHIVTIDALLQFMREIEGEFESVVGVTAEGARETLRRAKQRIQPPR